MGFLLLTRHYSYHLNHGYRWETISCIITRFFVSILHNISGMDSLRWMAEFKKDATRLANEQKIDLLMVVSALTKSVQNNTLAEIGQRLQEIRSYDVDMACKYESLAVHEILHHSCNSFCPAEQTGESNEDVNTEAPSGASGPPKSMVKESGADDGGTETAKEGPEACNKEGGTNTAVKETEEPGDDIEREVDNANESDNDSKRSSSGSGSSGSGSSDSGSSSSESDGDESESSGGGSPKRKRKCSPARRPSDKTDDQLAVSAEKPAEQPAEEPEYRVVDEYVEEKRRRVSYEGQAVKSKNSNVSSSSQAKSDKPIQSGLLVLGDSNVACRRLPEDMLHPNCHISANSGNTIKEAEISYDLMERSGNLRQTLLVVTGTNEIRDPGRVEMEVFSAVQLADRIEHLAKRHRVNCPNGEIFVWPVPLIRWYENQAQDLNMELRRRSGLVYLPMKVVYTEADGLHISARSLYALAKSIEKAGHVMLRDNLSRQSYETFRGEV